VITGKNQRRLMGTVSAYWRPATVEGALALAQRRGAVTVGGGTSVNAAPPCAQVEIIDLQALGLDRIESAPVGVSVGATATLQQIADDMAVPAAVRDAARREAPSTLRAAATIGGCVATGHWESEFLATLLACDAKVTLAQSRGTQELGLDVLLADRRPLQRVIITRVCIAGDGMTAAARTGRTPADRPIVCAVARRAAGGVRLALSGVAARPVLNSTALIRSGPDGAAWAEKLDPPGDFRGSSAYRRALAVTLTRRVVEAVT
jgi:probable selenate reductase FAD-binding subunit